MQVGQRHLVEIAQQQAPQTGSREIQGGRCTESAEPQAAAWSDNYICLPQQSAVRLQWNSAGGNVTDGLAIHDVIRHLVSTGVEIAIACDFRVAARGAGGDRVAQQDHGGGGRERCGAGQEASTSRIRAAPTTQDG